MLDAFSTSQEFVQHVGELCQEGAQTEAVQWQLTDHTGSVRIITNENAAVLARHHYLPFGDYAIAGQQQLPQAMNAPQQAAESTMSEPIQSTGFFNWQTTQLQRYGEMESDPSTGLRHTDWRKYDDWQGRWTTTDPAHSSMSVGDPQSFNRYAYVSNDPVNFVDPTGLYEGCIHKSLTKFLASLAGRSDEEAAALGRFAGDEPGGADSSKYAATSIKNAIKGLFRRGPSAQIHFASEARLQRGIANFDGYIALGTDQGNQQAAFVLHSIQDVHGAHQDYHLPLGHALAGHTPDRIIGDAKFLRAANESFQLLSGDKNASLSGQQVNDAIDAIFVGCGNTAIDIRTPAYPLVGGGGGGRDPIFYGWGGGLPGYLRAAYSLAAWTDSIGIGQPPPKNRRY